MATVRLCKDVHPWFESSIMYNSEGTDLPNSSLFEARSKRKDGRMDDLDPSQTMTPGACTGFKGGFQRLSQYMWTIFNSISIQEILASERLIYTMAEMRDNRIIMIGFRTPVTSVQACHTSQDKEDYRQMFTECLEDQIACSWNHSKGHHWALDASAVIQRRQS